MGYVISAETLSQFQRVKHYINYIEQVEGFKRDNNGKSPLPWFLSTLYNHSHSIVLFGLITNAYVIERVHPLMNLFLALNEINRISWLKFTIN